MARQQASPIVAVSSVLAQESLSSSPQAASGVDHQLSWLPLLIGLLIHAVLLVSIGFPLKTGYVRGAQQALSVIPSPLRSVFWFLGLVDKALAVFPFVRVAPCIAAGVFTHRRIGGGGINMGHLLPEIPRSPAHRVKHCVVFDHMEPAAAAAFGAEQFFEPFVA